MVSNVYFVSEGCFFRKKYGLNGKRLNHMTKTTETLNSDLGIYQMYSLRTKTVHLVDFTTMDPQFFLQ